MGDTRFAWRTGARYVLTWGFATLVAGALHRHSAWPFITLEGIAWFSAMTVAWIIEGRPAARHGASRQGELLQVLTLLVLLGSCTRDLWLREPTPSMPTLLALVALAASWVFRTRSVTHPNTGGRADRTSQQPQPGKLR